MAKKYDKAGKYPWTYCSLGGAVRVNIQSGEDIAHLGELDKKLWTVLSCPVSGLQFDETTLRMIDTDGDGKIRVKEVVAAAQWLTTVIKDRDALLKGDSVLPLDQINTECEAGRKLLRSARQILSNLKLEKDEISVADTSDSVAIFAETGANGDGVITEASTEDAALRETIRTIVDKIGSATDRSGAQGVTAEHIEAFYTALADYAAWQEAAVPEIFPYGDNTQAALEACEAVKDKISDYFMRCKLIAFTDAATAAVDVSAEQISAIAGENLTEHDAEISAYPIARPDKSGFLPFDAVNPAWKAKVDALRALVGLENKDGLKEDEWNAVLSGFAPYIAWRAAEKGSEVESLGLDAVKALLKADSKAALLALVEADKALEEEANSIDEVNKLTHLYRDFYKLLKNYVLFSDFYSPRKDELAIFEEGSLYIDQRCCRLCIRVSDMGQHADMAGLSGMFLLYCTCTSKTTGETMDIVAVMTDGSLRNLRPGLNGLFYDREGRDWDAKVMRVVDNPLSIKQAFWSPYVKFWNFITGLVNKSAAEKDEKAIAGLQAGATAAPADAAAKKQPFDIAKYAGIFAAVGMALGVLAAALAAIVSGIAKTPWWGLILILLGIMLVISGPSCFIAWGKLRRRNLGPVLNANGWAINSGAGVNIPFGRTLTSVARFPKLNLDDPYKPRTPLWRKLLCCFVALLAAAFVVLFATGNLKCIGLSSHDEPAVVEEAAAGTTAEGEDVIPAETISTTEE